MSSCPQVLRYIRHSSSRLVVNVSTMMDILQIFNIPFPQQILTLSLSLPIFFLIFRRSGAAKKLPYPPGPKAKPIIGNLLNLSVTKPWEAYQRLCNTYGECSCLDSGQDLVILSLFLEPRKCRLPGHSIPKDARRRELRKRSRAPRQAVRDLFRSDCTHHDKLVRILL